MKPTIGFIGLGIMGQHMAGHLIDAGFPLIGYDIVEAALANAVARGARPARSGQNVASQADVIISMVPDSPDVENLVLGEAGIIHVVRAGQVYADMSSIAPHTAIAVARRLAQQGVRSLDAPVSGGEVGARNAALSIMVGGPEDLFNEMLPIFQCMGKTIVLCGDHGAGQAVKACNQIQVALNFIGMAEALVLGTRLGVDPGIIIKVLSGGYAQTRVMDVRGPKIIAGDFAPGFRSRLHFKDLNIIMQTASELHVPLPATALAHQLFSALLAAGKGDLDHSAVITVLEALAGIEARSPSSGQV